MFVFAKESTEVSFDYNNLQTIKLFSGSGFSRFNREFFGSIRFKSSSFSGSTENMRAVLRIRLNQQTGSIAGHELRNFGNVAEINTLN